MSLLLDIWEASGIWGKKLSRQIDANKELKLKKHFTRLTKAEKDSIKSYWDGVKGLNLRYFELYKTSESQTIDPRYIPDDIYYVIVDSYFNKPLDCLYIDDKNLYDLFFPDIKQPQTIARKEAGQFLSKSYKILSEEDVILECIKVEQVVIKKSTNANGGHDIQFWKYDGQLQSSIDVLKGMLRAKYDFIIQECVTQHFEIAKLHPSSINTIRILTLNWHGKVYVLSSIIRMGANGSNVDNGHSGGIFCGINDDGRLKRCAYTYMTGEKFENTHPTTGAVFSDSVIPNFNRCKELVVNLAPRLTSFSRLTSWDLSVNENGDPILIEVNLAYGGLFFHQIANGPVFGNLTEDIITEIIREK